MPALDKAIYIQDMLQELERAKNGAAPVKMQTDSKEWWREVAQELGVRANSLERTNARLREQGQHLAHALDAALKVLDGVEWSPSLPWDDSCPCCTEHESDGHAPTCELAAARVVLRRARASISGGTTDAALAPARQEEAPDPSKCDHDVTCRHCGARWPGVRT